MLAAAARAAPPAALAWGIWALGAALYSMGFFQRVAPAVLTRELMTEFGIAAAGLGHLSAFYFYSYVAMQVPTGLMADRFGPRRVLAVGAATAAGGAALFAAAPDVVTASVGRLLVGGAVGVAFVCTLKLAAHWLPARQFALASGLALALGLLGAIGAGVPLRAAVNELGWRPVMGASALAAALVLVGIALVVRDDPAERGYASHFAPAHAQGAARASVWRGLAEVLRYRNTWLLVFAPQGVAGACIAFGGLWGVPYLVTVYGYSPERAAFYCSVLLVGLALGGPLFGALSDRLGARKPLYVIGTLGALVLWSPIVLASRPLHAAALLALLAAAGFAAGCMVIGFAYSKESVPARLAGTVGGVVNMGAMTGPMVLQPAIGWMLDRHWSGALEGGVRLYGAEAYRAGFVLMLAWIAASLALLLATRETHARQTP